MTAFRYGYPLGVERGSRRRVAPRQGATLRNGRLLETKDPLRVYVEIECEIESLMTTRPKDAERLIHEAESLSIDRVRDRKALIRIDDALAGHAFGGCAEDRKQYNKTRQP